MRPLVPLLGALGGITALFLFGGGKAKAKDSGGVELDAHGDKAGIDDPKFPSGGDNENSSSVDDAGGGSSGSGGGSGGGSNGSGGGGSAPAPVVDGSSGRAGAELAAKARAAVDAVASYIKAHKSSPTVSVVQVLAFQKALAGKLATDGKWGPKTRAAAAIALAVKESTLPAYAAKFAPKTETKAADAKKPVADKKPAQVVLGPKDKAQAAVNTVRGLIVKDKTPPTYAVAQVKAFQQSVRLVTGSKIEELKADGLWGPLTRSAAAATLGVAEDTLPAYAAKFAPKVAPAPAPAPTPKKPEPAPAPAPVAKKPDEKPPVATKSKLETLASSAVNTVRGLIVKDKTPPTSVVPAVKLFQAELSDSAVKADGLWGPKTRAAAARVLRVAESTLPEYAAKFGPKPAKAEVLPAPKATRTPVQAASDLYNYVTKINTAASTWGTKTRPNDTIKRAQADMGQLVADGIYGPGTRARGKALLGKAFPERK